VPRKATNLAFVVYAAARMVIVLLGNAKSAFVVRLVQTHFHPSAVLLVSCLVGIPGALLQERIAYVVVNVLLWSTFWFASSMCQLRYCSRVAWQKRMSW
jgi:hypothetical protein